eukprot:7911805-Pyramimonas_sp.AAC.1
MGRKARIVGSSSPSWAPSWGRLGGLFIRLGALWGRLGRLLGASWAVLERSWGALGRSSTP